MNLARTSLAMFVVALGAELPRAALTTQGASAQDQRCVTEARGEPGEALRLRDSAALSPYQGFVENKGQWPDEVLYFARQGTTELTIWRNAIALRLIEPSVADESAAGGSDQQPAPARYHDPVILHFKSGAEAARPLGVHGEDALPTRHHFLLGPVHVRDAHGFESVLFDELLGGIDIRVRIDAGRFEYDLIVEPGADLASLCIEVEGAGAASVSGDRMVLVTPSGPLEQGIPAAWQEDVRGQRIAVEAEFSMDFGACSPAAQSKRIAYGFKVQGRDPAQRLVIDPTLVFSTYLGGSGAEQLRGFDVLPSGATCVIADAPAGAPVTPGAFQIGYSGALDTWVGMLSATANQLEWGTFLGGGDAEQSCGVRVDADGTVVAVGHTWSADYPTTPGAYQTVHNGSSQSELFVSRLTTDGAALVWSTLFGAASQYEKAQRMGLFTDGDVLICGDPKLAVGFPTTPATFDPTHEGNELFLMRMSADGTQIRFVTYFNASTIVDMTLDAASNIYISGVIYMSDGPMPTTPGVLKPAPADGDYMDGFVTKISPMAEQLIWSTYVGGSWGEDSFIGLAVDPVGAVYLCGGAADPSFPVTPGVFDTVGNSPGDGFVMKILPNATAIAWSTFVGSTYTAGGEGFNKVAVDVAGSPIAAGSSVAPGYPVTGDAFQFGYVGTGTFGDGILTKLDPLGQTLEYSTYFGGTGNDHTRKVAVDATGVLTWGLYSSSPGMASPGVFDPTHNGSGDVLLTRFDLGIAPWRLLGSALQGEKEVPNLVGAGALMPGWPTRLSVRGVKPSTLMWAAIGFSQASIPLLGGTLVPTPDIALPFVSTPSGGFDISFPWPTITAGTDVYFQFWAWDPLAAQGWSATNGLKAMAQ